MNRIALILFLCGTFTGCASYKYANNVRLVAFQDNIAKGTSIGNIRGEDCTWQVLGIQLGGRPTVDKAFINARHQAGGAESAGFDSSGAGRGETLRYVNKVTTSNEGFNAGVVAKTCIVVKGVGYR